MPDTPTQIALGLVGLGKIARDQHLKAIADNPGFKLVATADPCARIDGIAGYDSLAEMLAAHPDIGAVSLCTPPATRAEIAAAALRAGRHVMLEKPPALTVEAAEALKALAGQAGLALFAAWHSRESRCVETARAWLGGKAIARASIDWREDIRQWHPGQDWILAENGFGIFDPGINALSILTALVPGPIELRAAQFDIPANRAAPIAARLDLRLPGDAPVETDEGTMTLREGGHVLDIDGQAVATCGNEEYSRLYRRFAGLIRDCQSDVDVAPLRLALDAFAKARSTTVQAFEF
jgi:D-galactose 1-dehydrogenase/L-arabinose 1- dehydrogenase